MIQSVMLVLLGFFIAAFAVLLLAPAYWRRAVRLTTESLKRSMPMTTAEIRADKDRIRAQSAIKIHRLHKRAEQSKLNEARQLIELNRRDARIYELEQRANEFQADLTENQNARRVMEQTINFRLPQIEARLLESKRLLSARDREMMHFVKTAQQHDVILSEAKAYHEQQRQEIERLRAALTLQQSRDRGRVRDPGFGAELALRSEMEALRSRNRDQTSLIERLQTELVRYRSSDDVPNTEAQGAKKETTDVAALNERNRILATEVEALKIKLQEQADRKMGVAADTPLSDQSDAQIDAQLLQNEVKKLREKTTAQSDEIDSLTAELKAMASSSQETGKPVIRLTKRVLNAKIGALEKRTERQAETIARLRAELASSNERAARQAASYMKEMRQIGLGPLAQPYEVRAKKAAGTGAGGYGTLTGSKGKGNGNGNGAPNGRRANGGSKSEGSRTDQPSPIVEPAVAKAEEKIKVLPDAKEPVAANGTDKKPEPAPEDPSKVQKKASEPRKRLIDRISGRD